MYSTTRAGKRASLAERVVLAPRDNDEDCGPGGGTSTGDSSKSMVQAGGGCARPPLGIRLAPFATTTGLPLNTNHWPLLVASALPWHSGLATSRNQQRPP